MFLGKIDVYSFANLHTHSEKVVSETQFEDGENSFI